MRYWVVVVSLGCDAGPPPRSPAPVTASNPPTSVAAVEVADAAVPAVPELPDAAIPPDAASTPRVDVRPSVRDAPPWIAGIDDRALKIGREYLATYVLRREGDQALVTLESRSTQGMVFGRGGPKTEREEWRLSVVEKGATLRFSALEAGGSVPFDECKRTRLSVARADAELRLRSEDDCGGKPSWKPAGTKRVTVLRCGETIAFAPPPGVEWVDHHGDCVIGSGWRALAKEP